MRWRARLDDPCARVTRKNTAPRSYLSNPQLGRVNNKMNHVRRVASPSGERTPGGADYSEKFVYRSGHPRPAAVPCVPRAVGAPQACPQVPPLPAGVRAAGEKEKPPNRTERGTNRGTPVAARRRSRLKKVPQDSSDPSEENCNLKALNLRPGSGAESRSAPLALPTICDGLARSP